MLLPPPARFLEVGSAHWQAANFASGEYDCDTGRIGGAGYGNAGVDINPNHLDDSRDDRPRDSSYLCDVGKDILPFCDDAWATVMAPEVLEHIAIDWWGHALSEIWRVTRNQVLITIPHVPEDHRVDNPELGDLDYIWDNHLFEPSVDSLSEMLTEHCPGATIHIELVSTFLCAQAIKRGWG